MGSKKKGYTVDPDDIDDKVATGPKKPSEGRTNSFTLKLKDNPKKMLAVQVYGMGGNASTNSTRTSHKVQQCQQILQVELQLRSGTVIAGIDALNPPVPTVEIPSWVNSYSLISLGLGLSDEPYEHVQGDSVLTVHGNGVTADTEQLPK